MRQFGLHYITLKLASPPGMYCYKILRQMSINTVKHIVAIYQYSEAYRFKKKQGLLILWVPCNATQSDSDICLLILCDIQHIEHWTFHWRLNTSNIEIQFSQIPCKSFREWHSPCTRSRVNPGESLSTRNKYHLHQGSLCSFLFFVSEYTEYTELILAGCLHRYVWKSTELDSRGMAVLLQIRFASLFKTFKDFQWKFDRPSQAYTWQELEERNGGLQVVCVSNFFQNPTRCEVWHKW